VTVTEALRSAVEAFESVDLAAWPGLPELAYLADVQGVLPVDEEVFGVGLLGSEERREIWFAVESSVYEGGLRIWVHDDHVLVIEGRHPVDATGEPLPAPDLGPPDIALETVLGPLVLERGELVYGTRGLALRVNPENDLLLGAVGFAPTTAQDYVERLRPRLESRRLLAHAAPDAGGDG